MRAPQRVLLNASYLAPGVSGGPETYLRGLVPALAREFPELALSLATTRSGARTLRDEGWEQFAKLSALLGIERTRFDVIHHGHDSSSAATATPAQDVRARYELLGRRVVLCVTAKRPHKNQELLVRAAPALAADVVIVLAGHPEPYEQML